MATEKIFIGRCVTGKYPDQVDIGFTQEHIDKLTQHLNEKGWVNCRVNKGKDSGKPYMEIVVYEPKGDGFPKTSRMTQDSVPRRTEERAHESKDIEDDLPF
jgi:hypothetical protein